jgi:hypothetical protein
MFVTFDAYLGDGLKYVRKKCPSIKTSLLGKVEVLAYQSFAFESSLTLENIGARLDHP